MSSLFVRTEVVLAPKLLRRVYYFLHSSIVFLKSWLKFKFKLKPRHKNYGMEWRQYDLRDCLCWLLMSTDRGPHMKAGALHALRINLAFTVQFRDVLRGEKSCS
jgi:hypothetical protein